MNKQYLAEANKWVADFDDMLNEYDSDASSINLANSGNASNKTSHLKTSTDIVYDDDDSVKDKLINILIEKTKTKIDKPSIIAFVALINKSISEWKTDAMNVDDVKKILKYAINNEIITVE